MEIISDSLKWYKRDFFTVFKLLLFQMVSSFVISLLPTLCLLLCSLKSEIFSLTPLKPCLSPCLPEKFVNELLH